MSRDCLLPRSIGMGDELAKMLERVSICTMMWNELEWKGLPLCIRERVAEGMRIVDRCITSVMEGDATIDIPTINANLAKVENIHRLVTAHNACRNLAERLVDDRKSDDAG